jgi:hypothetical protein
MDAAGFDAGQPLQLGDDRLIQRRLQTTRSRLARYVLTYQ